MMNYIENSFLACLLLISCAKEKDFTFIEAKLGDNEEAMAYVSGESKSGYFSNDTTNYFSVLGYKPGVGKIMIELHTKQLKEMTYYFGYENIPGSLIKATFEDESTFYSTIYSNPNSYKGKITITKIESNYIKGTFDFHASAKDTTKKIYVSEGKFYSELK